MDSEYDPTRGDVVGKIVFITGAGRGIGQALAISFAKHGAKALVLAALEDDELQGTAKLILSLAPACRVMLRAIDVRDNEQVATLVKAAASSVGDGRIDVLCANAGVAPPLQCVGDSSPDAWWLGMEVNLRGCYLAARAVLPLMQKHHYGRIIFTSSIAAGLVEPLTSSYQISKLAVTRLADCIDVEYKDDNIKTFAVHPGRISTRLLRCIEGDGAAEMSSSKLPSRPSQLDDVAKLQSMCLFLISPDADFLSGRWIDATRCIEDLCKEKDVIVKENLLRAEVSAGWDPATGRIRLSRSLG